MGLEFRGQDDVRFMELSLFIFLSVSQIRTYTWSLLGPPVVPFYPFLGQGPPTKIDDRKNRVPTYSHLSNLEDPVSMTLKQGSAPKMMADPWNA